jgi:hypothetical protein
MKKQLILLAGLFLLSGCSSSLFHTLTGSQTIIDWVDFIKWEDHSYEAIYEGVLADESYIEEVIGAVQFKVADNVTNPNYQTKNGDAAFHEKGTKIYAVKGHPELLAVKDNEETGGYRLYFTRDTGEYRWRFQDVPLGDVKRIEFYSLYAADENRQLSTWEDPNEINTIIQLLAASKEQPNFNANMAEKDPDFYSIVLYTDEPVAYKYTIQFDGETYYWSIGETHILSEDIGNFMPAK